MNIQEFKNKNGKITSYRIRGSTTGTLRLADRFSKLYRSSTIPKKVKHGTEKMPKHNKTE